MARRCRSGVRFEVINRTRLSTAWLERMVAAVTPAGLESFSIEFTPDSYSHGFAYPERQAARVWLADYVPESLPNPPGRKRSHRPALRAQLHSVQEVALFIAAHELLHLWQAEHGKPIDPRYPDIRLLDERDANARATRGLRHYRRCLVRSA
jgi:hypothetical protein